VSPFLRFDAASRATDIMMFNNRNLGALIVKDEPYVKSCSELQHGIQNSASRNPTASACSMKARLSP